MCSHSGYRGRSTSNSVGNKPNVINILWPRQNGRHFPYEILKYIFMNINRQILIRKSLIIVAKGWMDSKSSLVPVMAWRRKCAKTAHYYLSVNTTMVITRMNSGHFARGRWGGHFASKYMIIIRIFSLVTLTWLKVDTNGFHTKSSNDLQRCGK